MVKTKSGIYSIKCLITHRVYIGSAINLSKRWSEHIRTLRLNKHHSIKLQRAWNKYGEENFKFEMIESCEKEYLIIREQYHIDRVNAYRKGFNCVPNAGSCLGKKLTEVQKLHQRKVHLGHKCSDETRKKMSENMQGNHYSTGHSNWLGKNHTEESKKKISESHKGKSTTTGFKFSEESRQKMSIAAKKRGVTSHTMLGMHHTEETKKKMRETHKKQLEFKIDASGSN